MNAGYAELHCLSNFSFQRGASSALELFQRAKKQGYQALAITDECTLAGIVRAWQAAKSVELPLIIGSEVRIENGPKLVLLVENLEGYQTDHPRPTPYTERPVSSAARSRRRTLARAVGAVDPGRGR